MIAEVDKAYTLVEGMISKLNHEQRQELKKFLQVVLSEDNLYYPEPQHIIESMVEMADSIPDLSPVEELIRQDKLIAATKEYRRIMGAYLPEAKDAVVQMAVNMGHTWKWNK